MELQIGRKIIINITNIQKLLRKALLYRLITNIDKIVSTAGISHQELSTNTGRKGNWFNDAYNNNEDIRISSLAKVLSVVNNKIDIKQFSISNLYDEKVLRISSVISSLADENSLSINDFIFSEKDLFIDLVGDWGSLSSKKKLTSEEESCYQELQRLLKGNDKEDNYNA